MKIGLVRRGYSATGGAEAYLLRLAATLVREGHDLVLLSDVRWPDAILAAHEITLTRFVIEAPGPRLFAEGLRSALEENRCDFVLSLERVFSCDAFRAGDGVHAAWLDRRAKYEPQWKSGLRRWNPKHRHLLQLERSLFSGGAGLVIANSKMVQREIEERFSYPRERIHVIYNGVPASTAPANSRTEVRRELGLGEQDYVLLFAGSGWERKGLRFAIHAMNAAQLAQATLLVAGRGNSRGLPYSDRVRFLGPRADIPHLLAAADAFLLPTIYDPFSNACLEALAAGLPVITTHANGFSEIIEPGRDGEVIDEPHNIGALARAIRDWASAEKRTAARPRLLELGARFSIEENVRQTLALLPR